MASQSSSQTSQALSQSNSQVLVQTFSNLITIKLDEENYLPWRQQDEAMIKGYDLLNHFIGKGIPKKFANQDDQESDVISSKYR